MAARNNLQIRIDAGSTWAFPVIWKDAAGVPVDLTGYQARFQARRKIGAETALALDDTAGITITAADGRLDLQASAVQTSGLSGNYLYALEVESPVGIITTLLRGTLVVDPDLVDP